MHNHKSEKLPGNEPLISFRCNCCSFVEQIPKSVVDFFDVIDGGDASVPPRFDCMACDNGLLYPLHYVNHDGIVYKF